ncbi:BsuPI-related putative proteinase inhibitor [Sutcliffiella rhizosphaerae]|uniref:Intracellular proteinase inhibitor BsuPI domain-containing protein n=1 Tax=Sutcliffiella rhizosphaerae TaxID=2880967 RepID=A0ABM8YN09_9BACI|nr:BsuPI-related putative proteinase inhibitor [Sutcliffiella rhizosphaerae]CAG9621386.1 hypothetical protein BACCIP111883_02159 [Sutcliffiella rhizosphaerae]
MNRILLLLIISLLLTACGTGGNSSQENNGEQNESGQENVQGDSPDESKDEAKKQLEEEHQKEGELQGQLEANDSKDFLFTVTNDKEEDAEIYFSSGQEYDYVVIDESGATVKQLSAHAMFIQATKEVMLQPGDKLEYPVSFEEVTADLPPGNYSIHFTFTDTNHHAAAEEDFTVE